MNCRIDISCITYIYNIKFFIDNINNIYLQFLIHNTIFIYVIYRISYSAISFSKITLLYFFIISLYSSSYHRKSSKIWLRTGLSPEWPGIFERYLPSKMLIFAQGTSYLSIILYFLSFLQDPNLLNFT